MDGDSSESMMRRIVADMGKASMARRREKYAKRHGEKAVAPVQVDAVVESNDMSPDELEQILAGAK